MNQPPLVTRTGAAPKGRLPYLPSLIVCSVAAVLPVRGRILLAMAANFLFNHVLATARLAAFAAAKAAVEALVFVTYFLVLGPAALLARALGDDTLGVRGEPDSFFTEKEPPDTTDERLSRQF